MENQAAATPAVELPKEETKTTTTSALPAIPLVDIRETGPAQLAKDHKERGLRLIKTSTELFPRFPRLSKMLSAIVLPIGDFFSRRWLKKTDNPYREEIANIKKELGHRGVTTLNLSYEWGCTTTAVEKTSGPVLTRVLDWPFPALGETMVVAHQKGAAGEYHNITWPGLSGTFNAVAKGRFAAAINQAPMRRSWMGVVSDYIRGQRRVGKQKALPPAHLLRKVFDEAADYAAAKKMLSEAPIAVPVIFTLSGTKAGEGCVIERTENKAAIREMSGGNVGTANHFETHLNGHGTWRPRTDTSGSRAEASKKLNDADIDDAFSWFKAPIANELSRVAFVADAASGSLQLVGTLGAKPVTQVFKI